MKFLFASDSFKGTLSSTKIAELLTRAAKQVFPECECLGTPLADGGMGCNKFSLRTAGGYLYLWWAAWEKEQNKFMSLVLLPS